jgi:hypothetical protein
MHYYDEFCMKVREDYIWEMFAMIQFREHSRPICCPNCFEKVKVKVKFALEQATKTQRGNRGIALLFL